jgi:LacI family transcriptional regulator
LRTSGFRTSPLVMDKGFSKRARIADVAKVAGVSAATVSRVLNNPTIVRPDIQDQVRQAITSLGFRPDAAARALASRKSRTIGAVVPTLGVAIFAHGITGLQARLRDHGYTLLIANSEYDLAREEEELRVFIDRGVDGLVLVGDAISQSSRDMLEQHGIPTVTTYVSESRHGLPSVGVDNRDAMFRMTRHLLQLGHRQVGVINHSAATNDRTKARLAGVLDALQEYEIELEQERLLEVDYSVESGRAGLRKLLSRHPELTAVLCTSDALAIGALAEARSIGLHVPADLTITGYDNVEMSRHTDPALTTVNVPAVAIGKAAADQIAALIAGRKAADTAELVAEIVVRGSSGPPRDSVQLPRTDGKPHSS